MNLGSRMTWTLIHAGKVQLSSLNMRPVKLFDTSVAKETCTLHTLKLFFLATGLFSNLSNNGSVILRQFGIGHSTQLEEMIFQILLKTIIGRIPSSDAPRFWNLCVSLAFLWVSDLLVSPPPIQEIRLLQDDSIISKAYLSYLLPANVMKCFASSGLCVIVVWVPRLQCSHQRQLQLTLFVSACVQRSRFKIDTFMD